MEFRDRITFNIFVLSTIALFFGCTLDNWATDELYNIKGGKYVFRYDDLLLRLLITMCILRSLNVFSIH